MTPNPYVVDPIHAKGLHADEAQVGCPDCPRWQVRTRINGEGYTVVDNSPGGQTYGPFNTRAKADVFAEKAEPRALCDRRHDGVNDDRIGYFVKSIDGGEFFAEECKDCRWVEQLRERRP